MDEATANLIFELQLQDSRQIYEEQQSQVRRAQFQQDENVVIAEDSRGLQGYDQSVCRLVRRITESDCEKSSTTSYLKDLSVEFLALRLLSLTSLCFTKPTLRIGYPQSLPTCP